MNYTFTPEQQKQLARLQSFMLEYNRQVNLTRIVEPNQILEKHFVDSALPLTFQTFHEISPGASAADVGSGAGFPGLVWAIVRPDLKLTLIDSLQKRVDYLAKAANMLGLTNVTAVHGRAEELGREKNFRDRFDVTVARAVAALPVLVELCLPLTKPGGVFLAMKGETAETAAKTIKALRGELRESVDYTLPAGDKRRLYIIGKTGATPGMFPRKNAEIKRKTLEESEEKK
jgi:16S rRNA (guanine527-N7)-methyltransferase